MELFRRIREYMSLVKVNLLSPCRALNSFSALFSFRLRLTKPLGKPIVGDLEPTNFCNFSCGHCQVTHWDKLKNRLTLENYGNWIGNFKIQGMGEPFLNKQLPEIIHDLSKRNFFIEIVSNGSVLTDKVRETITQTDNLGFTVSFDGSTKERFESIRIGSDFDKVVKHLSAIRNSKPLKSKLSVSMVAFADQKDNKNLRLI